MPAHAAKPTPVTLDDLIRAKVAEALADPRPSIPMDEVFEGLKARHAARSARDL